MTQIVDMTAFTENMKFGGTKMRTRSGRYVDFLDPDPSAISMDDICTGMVRTPRYVGQTSIDIPWVIADHIVLSDALAQFLYPDEPPEFRGCVFHHDSGEAYTNDLVSPFKTALRKLGAGDALEKIEGNLDWAIHIHFGLPYPLPDGWKEKVKRVDTLAFRIEEAHFRPNPVEKGFLPLGFPRTGLPKPLYSEAERKYRMMDCWHSIKREIIAANYNARADMKVKSNLAVNFG